MLAITVTSISTTAQIYGGTTKLTLARNEMSAITVTGILTTAQIYGSTSGLTLVKNRTRAPRATCHFPIIPH